MTHFRSDLRAATAAAVIALVAAGACSKEKVPPPPPATTESPASAPPTERVVGPLSEADAAALATMNDRLKDVRRAPPQARDVTLPKLPDDATPQQIDTNQRLFEQKRARQRGPARSRATSSRRRRSR